jgi:uncharacterized membrane protein YidH (DUF202 family)
LTSAESGTSWRIGLQAERTALAWTRTSLALLANGVVLLMKDSSVVRGPIPLVLAGFAAATALSAYLIGVRRHRTLCLRPLPERISSRREVYVVGFSVLGLIVAVSLMLLV